MRILVGTFYTYENEFEDCVAAIRRQRYPHFEHVVFEKMVKKEAYEALYARFMGERDAFDLLVRVDADMIIPDENLFGGIVKLYEENPWMDMLQIQVHDWFPDRPVWGLQTYRNTVHWKRSDEDLFADNTPVPPERRMNDDHLLAPAAIHCPNPTPFQAFHYGLHRGLKILQPDRFTKQGGQARSHLANLDDVWAHFARSGDVRLALAVLGAELGLQGVFGVEHKDYVNPYAHEVFERYGTLGAREVAAEVERLRRRNWGFLPNDVRLELLWYWHGQDRLGTRALGRLLRGLRGTALRSALAQHLRRRLQPAPTDS